MKAAGPELKVLWRVRGRDKRVKKVRKAHMNSNLLSFLHELCSDLSFYTSSHNSYTLKSEKNRNSPAMTQGKQKVIHMGRYHRPG